MTGRVVRRVRLLLERLCLVPDLFVERVREDGPVRLKVLLGTASVFVAERVEAAGVRDGQRFQQDAMEQREDRGARANLDRQREEGGCQLLGA
jgi:hypothetical protein